MINLANVDNTSDAYNIISTLTQTALDLKCPRNNQSFTGIVSIASNVMFDAAPQDITFSTSSAAPYTLQFAFDSKQDTLTATTPVGGTQLLFGSTLKALKPGTNISITNDSTSLTINGPAISGKQDTLTASTASGAQAVLTGTTIKCLKPGVGITLTSDTGTSITVDGPSNGGGVILLTNPLLNATSKKIKAIKAGTNISIVEDTTNDVLTLNNTYALPTAPTFSNISTPKL